MMKAFPQKNADDLKAQVREKYGRLAEQGAGEDASCSSAASCGCATDVSESYPGLDGYAAEADLGLGCGLPIEHAQLQSGETVLDLGAGAGLDAFVAREEVGAEGRVLGVDMAAQMVEKARRSARKLDYDNVAFRQGDIEDLPIEDASVDVVVSNCVLNLVPDKAQAFREAHRVLRPGGRFVISDIVSAGALPEAIRRDAELHVGCVAGAMEKKAYLKVIAEGGFTGIRVADERALDLPDEVLRPHLSAEEQVAFRASGIGLLSVTVLGTKPARR